MKTINVDKKSFDLMYVDIHTKEEVKDVIDVIQSQTMSRNVDWDTNKVNRISVVPLIKNINLSEGVITDAHIAAYLNTVVKVKEERSILIDEKQLNRLLVNLSYLIATEGRIAVPNKILCNSQTTKLFTKLPDIFKIQINEYLNNNEFFITNTDIITLNQSNVIYPGYYIIKYIDENEIKYENIVEVGFFPEKQIARIKLS